MAKTMEFPMFGVQETATCSQPGGARAFFFRQLTMLTFPTEFPLDTTYCIAPTYGFLLDDAGRSPYP